jgi:hypothetical protein
VAKKPDISGPFAVIPYFTEQGIYFGITGNFFGITAFFGAM